MQQRPLAHLLLAGMFTALSAQELTLSTAAKTYSASEQIWMNLSVTNPAALAGAYKIDVGFSNDKLSFTGILPADKGPFAITPAAVCQGSVVSIAGFQGISDTGKGTVSLATLQFTPKSGSVAVDTATFSIVNREIYSTQATAMDLRITKLATSVLMPSTARVRAQKIIVSGNYLKFELPHEGTASITIFDLSGRTVAIPLAKSHCRAGFQAVPIGKSLGCGIYLIALRAEGLNVTTKMEVVK
jgi:hypothetical protein